MPRLQPLHLSDPLRWLGLGWRDFKRCPGIGLFYGACFMLMGWAIVVVFRNAPAYTLALCAGFLLVGPFLCLGLYRASQRLEAGGRAAFVDSLMAWSTRLAPLAIFGFVLLVLEMLWGRATLVLFALNFEGMPDFRGSLAALVDPENVLFTIGWIALGAVFASVIYAVSVVAMPMLLDRPVDAITAGLTSVRLVLDQPLVMWAWAAMIAAITFVALLPAFAGLLIAAPVLGHASWHAYRAAVAAD